jgi:aryl-alcohol dehydrogenase-like predicted oxidoreductase
MKIYYSVNGVGNSGSNTEVVEESIDRSRKRMGVNTLDLVQFHW